MNTLTQRSKRWQVGTRISPEAELALQNYPALLRQILFNRGFITNELAYQYITAALPEGILNKRLFGVTQAVERISWGMKRDELIVVYGDYDADGVTASALLVQTLERFGTRVRGYIPNRFDEGYGLNVEALRQLKNEGTGLVITVDCGVRSLEEAKFARNIGLDLIITDHHHPGADLPDCIALVNPKQPLDDYPEKDLAGVGLAYKLASALVEDCGPNLVEELDLADLLDLVAVGTVADLTPLKGENRALVRSGLQSIRKPRRQGLLSLIGSAGLRPEQITASQIAFVIGPRLNAAGRLESALAAFQLLTSKDVGEAGQIAQKLDNQNRERQQITREIQAAAELIALEKNKDALLLFAAHEDFNPGVVGLAASRLCELYHLPAIVAYKGDTHTRGSCRSISDFNITSALDQCSDLLERYGGHAAAAGFTIRNENLPALIERLESLANEELAEKDLRPVLVADAEVNLRDLKPDLLDYLEWLQPTGYGNPEPYFVSRDVTVKNSKLVGKESSHLKLILSDGWITFDAIAFQQGQWIDDLPLKIDIMYSYELNEFNGRKKLQLRIRDLKPSGTPD
jgi:single-stranded-DNA-specific exonuclease